MHARMHDRISFDIFFFYFVLLVLLADKTYKRERPTICIPKIISMKTQSKQTRVKRKRIYLYDIDMLEVYGSKVCYL